MPQSHSISKSKYIYNHKKDQEDVRDLIFTSEFHSLNILPIEFDLRTTGFVPPILDQGNLGCCAGNEISNAMKFCLEKEHSVIFQPSRLFIYYFGRVLDGSPSNQDTGITIRNGLKSIQKYGCCTEIPDWPYDITKYTQKPPLNCIVDAKKHIPQFKYLSVPQDLNSIKQALFAGFPIVIGIDVFSSLESQECISTGVIPVPETTSEQNLGGHCTGLYGWDDSTRRFLMMNSWGSVGQQGWFTIPYDYILNPDLCSDLWCIKFFK